MLIHVRSCQSSIYYHHEREWSKLCCLAFFSGILCLPCLSDWFPSHRFCLQEWFDPPHPRGVASHPIHPPWISPWCRLLQKAKPNWLPYIEVLIMCLYRKWHLVHSHLIINQGQAHHFNTLACMLQRFCKILQHNICSYNYVNWILVAQCEWLTYCTSTGFLTANHFISSLPIYWSPVSDF